MSTSHDITVARVGLIGLALTAWRHATLILIDGLLPSHPLALAFTFALYLGSFALLLVAFARLPRRDDLDETIARVAVPATFLVVATSFAWADGLFKDAQTWISTTDGHIYMDVAARKLLAGQSPYAQSLAEAFRAYRAPLNAATPLVDGDFSDRLAYPALAFLVLVPAVLLHVPTYLVYGAFFLAALALILHRAPWWIRAVVLTVFFVDDVWLRMAFGGVTDTVWAFFVIAAILSWRRRPIVAAVLIGLACSQKQHPWFLLPFLVARLSFEHETPPWRGHPRTFVTLVAATFLAINLPFILWGPMRWVYGVTEPLRAPMALLSEGFSALTMTGRSMMTRRELSIVFLSVYALAFFVYVRHVRVLRDWCWLLPGVILWFGYRALTSYWSFYGLAGVTAFLVARFDEKEDGERKDEEEKAKKKERGLTSWKIDVTAGACLLAGIAGLALFASRRPPPFAVTLLGPIESFDGRVVSLRLRVKNDLGRVVNPRFTLQWNVAQPLPWKVEKGPMLLGVGESADYTLRAIYIYNEFFATDGARVAVSAEGDPGVRSFIDVPPDPAYRHFDSVPNGHFNFADTRNGYPTGWAFRRSDGGAMLEQAEDLSSPARVTIEFGDVAPLGAEADPTRFFFQPPTLGAPPKTRARWASLETYIALPDGPTTFRLKIPDESNRPSFASIYGLVLSVRDFQGFVLFGEAGEGVLPTGERYVSLAAPRGEWTSVSVSLRELLRRLNAPLLERRAEYWRTPMVDLPTVPMGLSFYVSPSGSPARFELGDVDNGDLSPVDAILKNGSPAGLEEWRADLDLQLGTWWKAADHMEQAAALEPTTERMLRVGEIYLIGKDYKHARVAYERAVKFDDTPEAYRGVGHADFWLNDLAGAEAAFDRARERFLLKEKTKPRLGYAGALESLIITAGVRGECAAVKKYVDQLHDEVPERAPPPTDCK